MVVCLILYSPFKDIKRTCRWCLYGFFHVTFDIFEKNQFLEQVVQQIHRFFRIGNNYFRGDTCFSSFLRSPWRGTRLVAKTTNTEVVGIRYLMQKTGKGRRATERAKQGDAKQARQTKGKDMTVGAAPHIVFGWLKNPTRASLSTLSDTTTKDRFSLAEEKHDMCPCPGLFFGRFSFFTPWYSTFASSPTYPCSSRTATFVSLESSGSIICAKRESDGMGENLAEQMRITRQFVVLFVY